VLPDGITIVPLLHEAIADVIAGTSSIDDEPPATGVQVEARALSTGDASGSANARGSAARIASFVAIEGAILMNIESSQAL
jgi:hypothetical protein